MINTLEPAKFVSRGSWKSTRRGAWKCNVKQEYWRGMAVLHRRTHHWLWVQLRRTHLWLGVQLRWTRQNDSSEVIGHIIDHVLGMGRYRYQIFDTIDTGLRSDGIDTRKQYRSVSIHARAPLRMRKVYVSILSRENQWCHLVVTAVVTRSSSPLNMFLDILTCSWSWTRTLE